MRLATQCSVAVLVLLLPAGQTVRADFYQITDLGTLPGFPTSFAQGINASG
jgi:hypothetical protein